VYKNQNFDQKAKFCAKIKLSVKDGNFVEKYKFSTKNTNSDEKSKF